MTKGFYTLSKEGRNIIATSTNSTRTISFKPDHAKYSKLESYMAAGKLLSVTARGTMSGRKDYEGFYKALAAGKQTVKVNLTKLDDLEFSDDLFKPMATGTPVDQFLSTDGGFMPGSNIMAAGAPGVGKCVRYNTIIQVRNKKTGEVQKMTIKEFHDMVG